jgi:DNA segregation ATPase FtsK/SpoIIIE, S-DNA-T family
LARKVKKKSKSQTFPSSYVAARLKEGGFIVILAASLFLLIALWNYQLTDPGWSQTGTSLIVTNPTGPIGAWLADFFLYVFGYFAYFFPVILVGLSALLLREGYYRKGGDLGLLGLRAVGFLIFILSSDGLINLLVRQSQKKLPFETGGILGALIESQLLKEIGMMGSVLILFAGLLLGVTLATGLSWFDLLKKMTRSLFDGRILQFFSDRLPTRDTVLALFQQLPLPFRKSQNDDERYEEEEEEDEEDDDEDDDEDDEEDDDEDDDEEDDDEDDEYDEEEDVDLEAPAKKSKSRRLKKLQQATLIKRGRASVRSAKSVPVRALAPELPINDFGMSSPSFITTVKGSFPSLKLLEEAEDSDVAILSEADLQDLSQEVEARLEDFGIKAKVVAVYPGPVITRFELSLAPGLKVNKITALNKDLARSLSTVSVRVVEVIPGKAVVGLEIPNLKRKVVRLKEIVASEQFKQARSPINIALGSDISGHPVIVDIAKMPHVLVAGTTGAGKSVCINVMLLSLLYKATPDQVRLILVDPKMLELSVYEGIPHLLTPVVTDMKDAACALRWCVAEMERRYQLMSSLGVRNLSGYNEKVCQAIHAKEPIIDPLHKNLDDEAPRHLTTLPFIVVVIDEFADMMMVVGKKVEELIARIAQKARAAGIHLVLATQRPSVDVITGLIKSNIPTRISFQVSSRIDSRTILDQSGAEQLLGHGDMLYLPPGSGVPVRVHGAYVTDQEVHRVVADWKGRSSPNYIEDILNIQDTTGLNGDGILSDENAESDPLYDQAVQIVIDTRKASISGIQRRLKIGYNRAARMIEAMEVAGIVSSMENNTSREVLVSSQVQE